MLDILKKEKFIGLLRNIPIEKTENILCAMYKGGVRIFEFTYNPSQRDTVKAVARQFDTARACLGSDTALCAGTVVSTELAHAAIDCGAKAIISPNVNTEVIEFAKKNQLISIPGAFTPSEIAYAYDKGADIVKVFPILPQNIDYLKTVMSPLSHIPFITTGGVNPDTAETLLNTGAIAVAAGASILKKELVDSENYEEIERLARLHTSKTKNFIRC